MKKGISQRKKTPKFPLKTMQNVLLLPHVCTQNTRKIQSQITQKKEKWGFSHNNLSVIIIFPLKEKEEEEAKRINTTPSLTWYHPHVHSFIHLN